MSKKNSKLLGLLFLGLFAFGLWKSQVFQGLTLEGLQLHRDALSSWVVLNPTLSKVGFLGTYILIATLSLPGASVMALAAGAFFGLFWGVLLASVGSTVGATFAFLLARFFLRDWVQQRFSEFFSRIDQGIAKEGAFYLFSLRLIPLFPFFVVNLAMGLTQIGVGTFFWVSQIGMLLGTVVFVNAGRELANIHSLKDIVSPRLILSFVLIGTLPLLSKRIMEWIRNRRAT